jgi:hypothetical protein
MTKGELSIKRSIKYIVISIKTQTTAAFFFWGGGVGWEVVVRSIICGFSLFVGYFGINPLQKRRMTVLSYYQSKVAI